MFDRIGLFAALAAGSELAWAESAVGQFDGGYLLAAVALVALLLAVANPSWLRSLLSGLSSKRAEPAAGDASEESGEAASAREAQFGCIAPEPPVRYGYVSPEPVHYGSVAPYTDDDPESAQATPRAGAAMAEPAASSHAPVAKASTAPVSAPVSAESPVAETATVVAEPPAVAVSPVPASAPRRVAAPKPRRRTQRKAKRL
jgi:hypothetical protein